MWDEFLGDDELTANLTITIHQIIRAEVAPRFIYGVKARAFFIAVHVLWFLTAIFDCIKFRPRLSAESATKLVIR